jgi:hypothetical protein
MRQKTLPLTALTALALPLALASSGCASLTFQPGVQSIGEYKNTAKVAEAADDMKAKDGADVKVLIEAIPDGMAIKDKSLVYDHARYELLGKVSAEYKNPGAVNMGFWVYDYKEGENWRTGLCAWQVPLSWVSLTLWSWLSPTYYPCRVGAGSEEDRRQEVVSTLQKATKALGGDLVIVAGFGGVDFVTVNGNTGAVVASNSVGTLNGVGYAFKVKGPGPAKGGPEVKGATSI